MEEGITQELAEIGLGVLRLAVAVERLGHSSPAQTLDYVRCVRSPAIDLVAWSTGSIGWAEARTRLLQLAEQLDVEDVVVSAMVLDLLAGLEGSNLFEQARAS